jgi:hypothetical protein
MTCHPEPERHKNVEDEVAERRVVRDPNDISHLNADTRCSTQMHCTRIPMGVLY